MSAEDLDKLFRDKLKDKPVTPSNDVWERMQARMQQASQPETPNPFMVPVASEEKEERGTIRMWYYSAAAAVTMLLSVGLWVNRENIDPLQPSGTVATVQDAKPSTPKVISPSVENTTAPASNENENTASFPVTPSQTPEQNQALASVNTKPIAPVAKEKVKAAAGETRRNEARELERPKAPEKAQEPVMMAATTPSKTQEATKATPDAAGGLEIIVKLDNAQATPSLAQASTKETDTPQTEGQAGTGRVLKGILKQVKNLKDGEKVNLSELGITKHTYALETRIGNKKITKSIEL
ncbi:hypothetical protein [Rufibacter latericius]|uniref:Uncharacterized protein n=1 Tax=Rufibacter latericius TaxID=2487040 RepID=A0A3M9MYT1_9BACT|nr:hypothetical protein [Rufibacter latericius]RNI30640.1 hypothetical protein EFB08_05155 [Rufibacter latericius]